MMFVVLNDKKKDVREASSSKFNSGASRSYQELQMIIQPEIALLDIGND